MDKEEARAVLDEALASYRRKSYDQLVALIGQVEAFEIKGASGAAYQLEFEVQWDAAPDGDLRVFGTIDDGGLLNAFSPLCQDFIMTPDDQLLE